MRKLTVGGVVDPSPLLDAQCLKERRQSDSSDRVDRVVGDRQLSLADSLHVHLGQCEDCVDMLLQIGVGRDDLSQIFYRSKGYGVILRET